jgi:P-type Cu2+ transporter
LLASALNHETTPTMTANPAVNVDGYRAGNLENSWLVLDQASEWDAFSIDLTKDKTQPRIQSEFLLDGLHCAACSGIIEHALVQTAGIKSARVSMSKNRGVVVWSPEETKPSLILKAIHDLGYQATPASSLKDQSAEAKKQKAALWRWMVAAFCMMQVMMYAAPSYFTSPGDISNDMTRLLNWASWLMSLPVLLFSSSVFFKNAFQDLIHRRVSMDLPVALGILITFIVSSAATFDPTDWWGSTVYFDTMTMLVFFLLSARLIEVRLHKKTMGALEVLMNRIPESTSKRNADGSFCRVLNRQIKVGDIVQINLGEAFPADGNIVKGKTKVDESLLTGESTLIHKNLNDAVIAGSYNHGQMVEVRVERLGEATQYGKIIKLIHQAAIEKPRLSKLIDRIAKPFLIVVLLSAALAAALLWQQDHALALMTAVAVLIVTCPCALSLATPAAMLSSASAFVKNGILIKHLQAIENIADIDTIIFDKTGTLTNDQIAISEIRHKDGLTEQQVLALASALARHSNHPVSRAIVAKYIASNHPQIIQLNNIQETIGAGIQGNLQAEDQVTLNQQVQGTIKLGSSAFCATDVTDKLKQQVYLADTTGWIATFDLNEQIKANASEMINDLKQRDYFIELLSGDQYHTVANAAGILGIEDFTATCRPQDKLNRLEALKRQGKKILMVGDGLNDGPVLASAHVSIAMGKGVPLTHAHADYILLNGDIGQIPALISHAKKTMQIIKQNISWAVVYNLVCIPMAFFGLISAWLAGFGMALSSLIVVFNAIRLTKFINHPFKTVSI